MIANISSTSTTVTLEFDQSIALKGIPQYVSQLGSVPASVTQPSPGTVVLTYPAGSITQITVPFQDPAIRNATGGYVNPGVSPTT